MPIEFLQTNKLTNLVIGIRRPADSDDDDPLGFIVLWHLDSLSLAVSISENEDLELLTDKLDVIFLAFSRCTRRESRITHPTLFVFEFELIQDCTLMYRATSRSRRAY